MKEPNPEQSDYGYGRFYDSIDTVIIGNKTIKATGDIKDYFSHSEREVISEIPDQSSNFYEHRSIFFMTKNNFLSSKKATFVRSMHELNY